MNLKVSRQIEGSIYDATSTAVRNVLARCQAVETACGTDAFRAVIEGMVREAVAAAMADYTKSVDAKIAAADARINENAVAILQRVDAAFGRIGDAETRLAAVESNRLAEIESRIGALEMAQSFAETGKTPTEIAQECNGNTDTPNPITGEVQG